MGAFLAHAATATDRALIVEAKRKVDQQRVDLLFGHQVATMWLESYCGVHVFLEQRPSDEQRALQDAYGFMPPADPQPLYRVRQGQNFEMFSTIPEAITACQKKLNATIPWKSLGG